eukprot:m.25685 g.25685  ORF g.25685 m.25685 type:complete len:557 (-) comp7733_c0_seq1:109-1779(-)
MPIHSQLPTRMFIQNCDVCICAAILLTIIVATAGCPEYTNKIQTPNSMYCVCHDDYSCSGLGCKIGNHNGKIIHGFPVTCADCICSNNLEAIPTAASKADVTRAPVAETKAHEEKNDEWHIHVIYIKSYKVASTTIAAIFQRIAEERGLRAANRYNSGLPTRERARGTFHMVFGHNFYDQNTPGGFPCKVKLVDGKWTSCGGYQAWMDFYVTAAVHVVMVSEPLARIPSMYYYEAGYTKQRDRAPEHMEYQRIANDARFSDPAGLDNAHIAKFLTEYEYYNKWERVQWWWLRDITEQKTLDETVEVLRRKFVVGLSSRLEESLLLWKRRLRLETRDILYTSMKASLSHPKIKEWSEENQQMAKQLVETSGDGEYYKASVALFEKQISEYGREQLSDDLAAFRMLLQHLHQACSMYAVLSENLHVPDQVYCMLQHYDKLYEQQHSQGSYLGCYSSLTTENARFAQKLLSMQMTHTLCIRRCKKEEGKKMTYYGLAHGSHCYCGSYDPSTSSKVSDDLCQLPCTGNNKTICGGHDVYAMYKMTTRGPDWRDPILKLDS